MEDNASASSLRGAAAAERGSQQASCCGQLEGYLQRSSTQLAARPLAIALGNERGTCCIIEHGFSRSQMLHIFSASKMLTGYVILRLIDEGRLRLRTRADEVLSWWGTAGGGCANVTVYHLLSQTGSLNMFRDGIGRCRANDLVACAQEAYHDSCAARSLGSSFVYAETSFYVLGAIALATTGLQTYNEVFRRYLARPLNLSESCVFDWPSLQKADPGGGARCTVLDYARFLRAALADEIVSKELRRQAELPQTLLQGADLNGHRWHYGLGLWRECLKEGGGRCDYSLGVKASSMGIMGYYPWLWRRGKQSHWGVLARAGSQSPVEVSVAMGKDIFPIAAEAMERLAVPPAKGGPETLPLQPVGGGELERVMLNVLSVQTVSFILLCICAGVLLCCARRFWAWCRGGSPTLVPDSARPSAQKIGEAYADEEAEELFEVV